MADKQEGKKPNPFNTAILKNLGRTVTVVMFTPQGTVKLTGKCEAVDLYQKSIVLRDDEHTYTIPRYLYLKRERPERGDNGE